MDGKMDRPLPSTTQVGIVLSLAIAMIAGCGRTPELADHTQTPAPKVVAPNRFQAPDDVRPMTQLAAHLVISEAHAAASAIENSDSNPTRLPPVGQDQKPTSLETIRFPIRIEKKPSSENLPQLEPVPTPVKAPEAGFDSFFAEPPLPSAAPKRPASIPVQPNPAPQPQPAITPAVEASTPLVLNGPELEMPPQPTPAASQPRMSAEEFLANLPPQEPLPEPTSQMREIPNNTVLPNYVGPASPQKSVLESPAPRQPGPRADYVSLAPQQVELAPANPAMQEIVNLPGPPMDIRSQMQNMLPIGPQMVPSPQQPTPSIDHAMLAVRGRMDSLVNHGLILAQRGAYFSARAEFIQVLRLATQTLDTAEKSHRHSDALAEAIVALEEAGDFIPSGARLEANVDLSMVVSSHRTPVLKNRDLQFETALTAAQLYFNYAQDKLSIACGGVPETARALVGLGRIQEYLYKTTGDNRTLIGPRSMALFQTALAIDGSNFEAANELGVMLARYGQLEDAKQVLLQGVKSSPRAEIWQNLASVHQSLGEAEMAQRASTEAQLARQFSETNAGLDAVRWVSPEEMAQHGKGDTGLKQAPSGEAIDPIARRQRTTPR